MQTMRRTNLATLLLAATLSGLSAESMAAARAMRGATIPHHRIKGGSPKPSRFERDVLRPATYDSLQLRGKIRPEHYVKLRGSK